MSAAAGGPAAASPFLDAAHTEAGLLPQRFAPSQVVTAEIDPATLMALASIAPGAGDPGRPLGDRDARGLRPAEIGDAAPMRRAVRGLVLEEPRSGFVDDPVCGFAQDVESKAATLDCGTPLRLAMSTIPGLHLFTRAVSAPLPDLRFEIAPDALVSAVPIPATAWLLAALSAVLVLRPSAFRARTPR